MSDTLISPPPDPRPVRARPGLGLAALTAIVVGSMIGSGIFALPSQMAGSAAPGPLLIGWVITGVGMLTLAFVFQTLATRKPDVDGGVYGYARAGFGNYIGFTSAFGYWVSAWVGNVAYLVLLFSTLGYFFPVFEGGATVPAIIGASVVLWIVHAMTLRGVQTAAFVNVVVTIAKVVPILVFIAIAAVGFKAGLFTADFWGRSHADRRGSTRRHDDASQEHDAGHRVGVHRHRGRVGLLPARRQAQGRRPGHGARLRRGVGAAAHGQPAVVRLDGAGGTRRRARPVDGRGAGERGRQLGRGVHLDRPGRLAARRPDRMGAAVRRDPAPARPRTRDAEGAGQGERPRRTGQRAVADQLVRPGAAAVDPRQREHLHQPGLPGDVVDPAALPVVGGLPGAAGGAR